MDSVAAVGQKCKLVVGIIIARESCDWYYVHIVCTLYP